MNPLDVHKTPMNSTMAEFIQNHYTVVWTHPESTGKNWTVFLLQQECFDEETKKINGQFISSFWTKGSVLLLGGVPSFDSPFSYQRDYEQLYLSPEVIKSDEVLGWDTARFSDLDFKRLVLDLSVMMTEAIPHIIRELGSKLKDPRQIVDVLSRCSWDRLFKTDMPEKELSAKQSDVIGVAIVRTRDFMQDVLLDLPLNQWERPLLEKNKKLKIERAALFKSSVPDRIQAMVGTLSRVHECVLEPVFIVNRAS